MPHMQQHRNAVGRICIVIAGRMQHIGVYISSECDLISGCQLCDLDIHAAGQFDRFGHAGICFNTVPACGNVDPGRFCYFEDGSETAGVIYVRMREKYRIQFDSFALQIIRSGCVFKPCIDQVMMSL